MFGTLGPMEMVLILLILVLLFGAKKLPQLGEGIGKALKNFKKSVNDPIEDKDSSETKKIDSEG
jgi:sec-independent protein translocase protein TatA